MEHRVHAVQGTGLVHLTQGGWGVDLQYKLTVHLRLNEEPNLIRTELEHVSLTRRRFQVPGGVISVGDKIRVQGLGSPVLYFGDGAESLQVNPAP